METKPWYKSRTIWYAIITGISGSVEAFHTQYPELALLSLINMLLIVALRTITTTQIQ